MMVAGRPSSDRHRDDEFRIGLKMGGLGMEVASQVAAGALLGWAFDSWRGTAPTGLVVGALAGILVGLWSLIKGALKLHRQLDRQNPVRKPSGGWRPVTDDDDESQDSDDGTLDRHDDPQR